MVIPLTEENLRAVAMDHDLSADVEVDAYLSGSMVQALTRAPENRDVDLNLNKPNVEIQAGLDDFQVQCENIGEGPDGVLRMCVLDNGEVIESLKNHLDPFATSEILNNGYERLYEDNSETILNIATESIQSTQFLENAIASNSFRTTIQEMPTRGTIEDTAPSNPSHTAEILEELESRVNFAEQLTQNEPNVDSLFIPDFDSLLWSENEEPNPKQASKEKPSAETNEYIDIGDFAFLLKDEKDGLDKLKCKCDKSGEVEDNCKPTIPTTNQLNDMPELHSKEENNAPNKPIVTCRKSGRNETEKSCCVTVCLNTLKQLRKVLEQRCC